MIFATRWLVLTLLLLGAVAHLAPPPEAAPRRAGKETRQVAYPDGKLKAVWEVRLDEEGKPVRHGRLVRYHPNGNPALQGWYKEGAPAGTWDWWDPDKVLLRTIRYEYGIPMPVFGEELTFATTAVRKLNGDKTAEGHMKGNMPHGRWRFWYEPGVPKAEGEYITGIPEGRWIHYYSNGQTERDLHYQMGIPHGEFRESYPSGRERSRGMMDQGFKSGPWRFWHPNGRLATAGTYAGDLQEGEWRFWSESGEMTHRIIYRGGRVAERLSLPEAKSAPEPFAPIPDDLRPPPRLFDEEDRPIERKN